MNKTLISFLLASAFSSAVVASPYLGLEYGYGTTNHDYNANFASDNIALDPSNEEGVFGAFAGYSFNEKWAIEFGYNQYELDDGRSQYNGTVPLPGGEYHQETEWDASVKAKQFTLAPVYTHAFNDKWTMKVKAGLTYTQYTTSQSKEEEFELVTNDDNEFTNTLVHEKKDFNEVGGVVAVGAEYAILPQLTLGANAKYQLDSFANTASLNVSITYYF
ncbi:AcfA family outer membrane beta-barrel protein [Vibrio paucivorans]